MYSFDDHLVGFSNWWLWRCEREILANQRASSQHQFENSSYSNYLILVLFACPWNGQWSKQSLTKLQLFLKLQVSEHSYKGKYIQHHHQCFDCSKTVHRIFLFFHLLFLKWIYFIQARFQGLHHYWWQRWGQSWPIKQSHQHKSSLWCKYIIIF